VRLAAQMEALVRGRRMVDIARSGSVTGLDSLRVFADPEDPARFRLDVRFIKAASGVSKDRVLANLRRDSFRVVGPDRELAVESIERHREIFRVWIRQARRTDEPDLLNPLYTLELAGVPDVDPFFVKLSFRLNQDLQNTDCLICAEPALESIELPYIDYLARDYASFRRLILDLMSQWSPAWRERSPADLGVVLVEIMAYAGDYLSYYQDAAATEAWLGSARERISVRRHARLLDYRLHDGCNSRVWVQVAVSDATSLSRGSRFLSGVARPKILPGELEGLSSDPQVRVFESMHDVQLHPKQNRMRIYTWRAREFVLRKGATRATLVGEHSHLRAGDAIVFETVCVVQDGCEINGEPYLIDVPSEQRHIVRLSKHPLTGVDVLYNEKMTEIEWYSEDALPFDMPVHEAQEGIVDPEPVTVARGNMVLCDSGWTLSGERLPKPSAPKAYRPPLEYKRLTFAVPYDPQSATSASQALQQESKDALARCTVWEFPPYGIGNSQRWEVRPDLLHSGQFERHFVLEIDSHGTPVLRFGDGSYGRAPAAGAHMTADYRLGNGPAGNVGPDTITTIVTYNTHIQSVRNPRAAEGGTVPETLDHARLFAPKAHSRKERCVTEDDYRFIAKRHAQVKNVALSSRPTGSWNADFLYVQREGGLFADRVFLESLRNFLQPFRLLGRTLCVRSPDFAPLDIVLRVILAERQPAAIAQHSLNAQFSNRILPDGKQGFFHPDNFTFGKKLLLKHLIAAAEAVSGVASAQAVRFERWDNHRNGLDDGVIEAGKTEILRLDNDPAAPQRGQIQFKLQGGQ
jgi:Baseplate J-like protein